MRPVSAQTGGGSSPHLRTSTARVWDAESGKPVGEPMRHEDIVSVRPSFSPDGRRIVTVSDDKIARVWDAGSGKPVGEPMRHRESGSTRQASARTGGGSSPPLRTRPRECGTPRAAGR